MRIDLCPNCGRSPGHEGNNKPKSSNDYEQGIGNYYVRCHNCGLTGPLGSDEVEAVKDWNRIVFCEQQS